MRVNPKIFSILLGATLSCAPAARSEVTPAIAAGAGLYIDPYWLYNYYSGYVLTLMIDGTLWGWGFNESGQLGDGSTIGFRKTPVPIPDFSEVTKIRAGQSGNSPSLALKTDGTVWGWGQVGRMIDSPSATNRPTSVLRGSSMTAIAAGGEHAVALKNDGTVWAGGDYYYGQLGDGTTEVRTGLVQVLNLSDVTAIAAGSYHSLALKRDGTVWAWGINGGGELGDGTDINRLAPVSVSGMSGVKNVWAGFTQSLALKNDGTVWAWGYGIFGDGNWTHYTPVQVSNLVDVTAMAAGMEHTLALKTDGTVWAFGRGSYGQLGNGIFTTNSSYAVYQLFQVVGLSNVFAIAAGLYFSVALKSDGTVWTWGKNEYGELGDGTTNNQSAPVWVQRLPNLFLPPPSGLTASSGTYRDRVRLTWNSVPTASRYQIWRSDLESSDLAGLLDETTATTYDDTMVELGTLYYYWVKSIGALGNSGFGSAVSGRSSFSGSIPIPAGSQITAGDFDGDKKADPAACATNGDWYAWLSSVGYAGSGPYQLGIVGHPAAGDFDGDKKADPAVCMSNGNWYVWLSGAGYVRTGPHALVVSGWPTAGDFDGDRFADPAISDQHGTWYVWMSRTGYIQSGPFGLGVSGQPALGDFGGDGFADPVMYQSGDWYVWFSGLAYARLGPFGLGVSGQPAISDFDGDGLADLAVRDTNELWYVWLSIAGYTAFGPFGL